MPKVGFNHFHYQVACGVFERDGKYLVQKRPEGKQFPGHWEFPGGKVEEFEKHVVVALFREWEEELGGKVTVDGPLAAMFNLLMPGEDSKITADIFMFPVTKVSQEPSPREGQEIAWMSLEELEQVQLVPSMRGFIERLKLETG